MKGGYYSPDDPNTLIPFPTGRRYGGANTIVEDDASETTPSGQQWVEKRFARREWAYPFLLLDTDLEFFRDLHEATDGQVTPFEFVEDVNASPLVPYLVRKEQNFEPVPLGFSVQVDGVIYLVYNYTLKLSLELRRMKLALLVDGVLFTRMNAALGDALAVATTITDSTLTYTFTKTSFLGGYLLNGTPLNVIFGRGWIAGQITALKTALITPFLIERTADWFEFYGL